MRGRKSLGWAGAIAITFVVAAYPFAVAKAAGQARTDPMLAENVQRGAKTFAANCAFCHGPTAKGSSNGPSLIDSAIVRHDKDGDLIGRVIHEGRLEKGMPSFPSMDAAKTADIVAFLHARVLATDSRETAGPRSGYDLQRLLTGDASAGRAYFNGAGGCSKCHSISGDLTGVASKYPPSQLENRMLYPRGKASLATVEAGDKTKVKGTLAHLDPFYVAVIDSSGRYHSWNRNAVRVEVEDPLHEHLNLLGRYTNKDIHDLFAYLETLR